MWMYVIIAAVSLSCLVGFAALGRFNRRRAALIILVLELAAAVFYYLRGQGAEEEFLRLALHDLAIYQLLYMVLSCIGWGAGRIWRRSALGR